MLDEKFVQEAVKNAIREIAKKEVVALIEKAVEEYLNAELDSKIEDSLDIQTIADQVKDELNFGEVDDLEDRVKELEDIISKLKDALL